MGSTVHMVIALEIPCTIPTKPKQRYPSLLLNFEFIKAERDSQMKKSSSSLVHEGLLLVLKGFLSY